MTAVLLVRHTEVARRWHGRCYGRSDVGLSHAGRIAVRTFVDGWAEPAIDAIVHSGSRRAAFLAASLGRRVGIAPIVDTDWQERDFGAWEGRSWAAIWRATGSDMDGMLTQPASFRPGGGETTAELITRSVAAWDRLPAGRVAVIAHAGSIAAVRLSQEGRPPGDIAGYVPALGSVTRLRHPDDAGPARSCPL